MLIDSQELFSAAQAVTAIGDTVSTNVLDTGAAADDGVGYTPQLAISAVQTPASATGTMQFVLQTSTDNATWVDVQMSRSMTAAQLTALIAQNNGFLYLTNIPVGLSRYIRVVYRVGTAVFTAGTYNAFLVVNEQLNKPYASGFAVL